MNTYEVTNKIKSSKWNSFLLKQDEVEEYLADGIPVPSGIFSRFSKAKKDDDARRNKRMVELFNLKVCQISEEYFKHNVIKPDKKIISMIIEPTKNLLFGRKVSFIFKSKPKENDPISIQIKELIDEGKKESGDIVASYPISIMKNRAEKSILFITTNGICFVEINGGLITTTAPYAAANAAGPAFGAIAAGIVAVAAKYVAHSAENYRLNKEQKKIIELAQKYSPCLVAKCFENSQFVPYKIINALIYGKEIKSNRFFLNCIYENIHKGVFLETSRDVLLGIVEKLSGDNPPEVK